MTQSELKQAMTKLYQELLNPIVQNHAVTHKNVIAKAVQLGMKYQEDIIKEGIDIIFKELHNKNIQQ